MKQKLKELKNVKWTYTYSRKFRFGIKQDW
jgi:hypothetical protein